MQAYGNLTNRILETATKGQPEPTVGMDATVTWYSDRHAATVTRVFTDGKTVLVEVQDDETVADKTKTPRMGHQDWVHTPNPNGAKATFRWNATTCRWDGVRFKERAPFDGTKGRWVLERGNGLILGRKDHYHDWGF